MRRAGDDALPETHGLLTHTHTHGLTHIGSHGRTFAGPHGRTIPHTHRLARALYHKIRDFIRSYLQSLRRLTAIHVARVAFHSSSLAVVCRVLGVPSAFRVFFCVQRFFFESFATSLSLSGKVTRGDDWFRSLHSLCRCFARLPS